MITCPHCGKDFEHASLTVANKPYVGRVFHIKNVQYIYVKPGNVRANTIRIDRDLLPEAAMILDENGTYLSIADAESRIYWIKRSYFFKEAT